MIAEKEEYLSGSDNELSNDSDNFKEIMSIYQKGKKQKGSNKSGMKLPQEVANLMGEANQYYMFQHFKEAIDKLLEIIRIYPNFPEPYHLLAMIHEELGDLKKAAYFYQLVGELSSKEIDLQQKIAYLFKEAKCYELASQSFGRALKSDPLNTQLMVERAQCYENFGDIKHAIKLLEKALKTDPNDFQILKKTAKLYTQSKQGEKALQLFQPWAKKLPVDFNILFMIAEIYLHIEDYTNCVEYFDNYCDEMGFEIQDFPLQLKINYGICKSKSKGIESAKDLFVEAFQCENKEDENQLLVEFPDLYLQVAELYESFNLNEEALEIYEKIITLQQYDNETIWYKLGLLYKKINDNQSAIDAFQQVMQANPDYTEAKFQLANLYFEAGEIEKALKILGKLEAPVDASENKSQQKKQSQEEIYFSEEEKSQDNDNEKEKEMDIKQEINKYKQPRKKVKLEKKDSQQQENEIKLSLENLQFIDQSEDLNGKSQFLENQQEQQLTFIQKIEDQQNYITENFNFDSIRLQFKKADILFESCQKLEAARTLFEPLKQALLLEQNIQNLKTRIYNKYLLESQKKTFKYAIKSSNFLKNLAHQNQNLLMSEKQLSNQEELLSKKKKKISSLLTDKQIAKLNFFSKTEEGKITLLNFTKKSVETFYQNKLFEEAFILLLEIGKLNFLNQNQYSEFKIDFLFYGQIISCKLKKYEYAYYYLRKLFKLNPAHYLDNVYLLTVLGIILSKIDTFVYRCFLQKLSLRLTNIEYITFRNKSSLHFSQLIGNSYLQTGYYELAIKSYLSKIGTNSDHTLIYLCLGAAYLQDALSRTTFNKTEQAKKAFYYLSKYQKLRESSQPVETLYNLGRAFTLVSMYKKASEYFEQCIYLCQSKINNEGPDLNTKYLKMSAYNLAMIQKYLGNYQSAGEIIRTYLNLDGRV